MPLGRPGLLRGGHPDLHKQGGGVVRDAAERFCKEMLIKTRRASGDATASLNDYDRKNLGELCPQVETLLALDPSHPGKLRAIGGAVNPANPGGGRAQSRPRRFEISQEQVSLTRRLRGGLRLRARSRFGPCQSRADVVVL
jgi:hypothetical protein